ncbi:MAG: ABC transporter ATP-binding protein [Candidatus Saccharibacteria bacterium]|nr:ABC transporter ATP-binding protein [Candidatus Saccharibacteria bacterium]
MIIEIKNLYKSFGDVKAVQDLSFQVEKGELFAFLGENGAGKSTTISIMCGQLEKDAGEVLICGKNIDKKMREISGKIGVVFQNSALDKALSVRDNLVYRGALYGITGEKLEKRLEELNELLHIKELYKRTVGKLSGGQRRRIDIARALLQKPEILILDEPTTGLDPQTRKMLWDAISKMRKEQGMTVFLTTHYMEEAAEADHVVILDHGQISAEGTPIELKNKYTGDFIRVYNVSEKRVKELGVPYEKIPEGFRMSVKNTKEATKLIVANPEIFSDYEVTKGKMDDVFLAVTGKKLEGDQK